ncbi:MAG: 50S ribosomal protein L35 [Candidatus Omnitrophota bacterium]
MKMKLKTKKGVAKRFKITKKKKIKYSPCGKSHLQTHKKSSRVRKLRRARLIQGVSKYLRRMLPGS